MLYQTDFETGDTGDDDRDEKGDRGSIDTEKRGSDDVGDHGSDHEGEDVSDDTSNDDSDDVEEDDCRPCRPGKSSVSECRAFTLLASVCSCWRQTLIGWPQSSTRHWVRHKLKKLIEREYFIMCQYVIVAVDDCIRY